VAAPQASRAPCIALCATNAASLSAVAGCQLARNLAGGYGLAGAVTGLDTGSGRAYLPLPVLARKPRRVHSPSWVSMLRGLMPSMSARSCPAQSRPGWLAMMRVTLSLLVSGRGWRGGWLRQRGSAAGRSGGGAKMVTSTRVIVVGSSGRSWSRRW
jgi:hypothetical protein